ncbi:hypothetical protein E2N92_02725 [Methanofollis formosanus]|uniref:DUF5320 domain-containing protein n=1 Tax=Methanofollis formosanus TaxID=299308 RepID=A0A8G1EF20_9EURY|nr:DUF5320 domain-containing protein [Methanofollis formosanus]QYZ78420.1 hypothetical protein E2N92_02725 [Methanofollis formosanus]
MPGMDGTGPQGRGPLTGWGRGRCRPVAPAPIAETDEKAAPAPPQQGVVYGLGRGGLPRGCGRGRGFGGGRGRRW